MADIGARRRSWVLARCSTLLLHSARLRSGLHIGVWGMTCGDGKRSGQRGGDLLGSGVRILWGRVLTWRDDCGWPGACLGNWGGARL